jgi:sulfoxide reductase heme-binding subunit YedZ
MKSIKALVFILLLVPLFMLVYYGVFDQLQLTAEPVEYILHYTGIWSLRLLLLTLAMTPLRNITKQVVFLRLRRMIGLFVFFYVSLHLFVYIGLDLGFAFDHLWKDIIKHPYITVGFLAWLLLIPLAVTSNKKMIRKLGKKWKPLHQSIYVIVILACLHFIWLVKKDLQEPLIYAGIAFVLLFYRLIKYSRS